MTFQPTTTLPTQNPSVKIFFHGLNILRSPDGLSCIVETLRAPRHPHTLSVEVRAKMPNEPDMIIMRHFGHLTGNHPGLSIRVDSASDPKAFKYVPIGSFDPARTPTTAADRRDFRWVINLEAEHFHAHTLTVDPDKTRPSILIYSGIYYFYAAQLLMGPIAVRQGSTPKPEPLAAMASIIGANLYLEDGSKASIKWRLNGEEVELPLGKLDIAAGAHYEVYIDNSPLFEPPSGPTHSELVQYYEVIPGIPPGQQHNLDFPEAVAARSEKGALAAQLSGSAKFDTSRGSARIPCQSITLDGIET